MNRDDNPDAEAEREDGGADRRAADLGGRGEQQREGLLLLRGGAGSQFNRIIENLFENLFEIF